MLIIAPEEQAQIDATRQALLEAYTKAVKEDQSND